jgi:hypothetical protein
MRAAALILLFGAAAAAPRFFGLYSECKDAACSDCVNSTMYLDRCDFEGGPGMMSIKNVCNESAHAILSLEYATSATCDGDEHANPIPTDTCIAGPFGEHYAYYCGTKPYEPSPPPGGVYGQIVEAIAADKTCRDPNTVEWEWFVPGACTSPELFMTQIIDCNVARGTWSHVTFESEDCTGPALTNVTGRLDECAEQDGNDGRIQYQCSLAPIPPP